MDFSLDDDHLALRDAVQRFCDGEYPAHERGNPETPEQARRRRAGMAELGLLGLPFDAELGGSGFGPVEAMLVAQELGRALAAGPWLPGVVMAGQLLAELATPAQCAQWLPAIARGELSAALACHEADARYAAARVQTCAQRDAEGWQLDGEKVLVLGGDSADLLLVLARTDGATDDREGLTLFAVEANAPGVVVRGHATLDGRRAATVVLSRVRVPDARIVGRRGAALDGVERALDRAEAALCADAAGALDALLDLTAEHLRTRRQFGAPLAKFQALQHRVADMAIALEQLKSMACAAALALQSDSARERQRLVSAAKSLVAQLGRRCAFDAIQLHGAMGMTDECRASHYARRLIGIGQWFGDSAFHLRRFASP